MLGGERELLLEAFDSNWIAPKGPQISAFEAEVTRILGVDYAVALNSGTSAIHLALSTAGVGPGDTVVTSSFTFVASANAIKYLNAIPVFVDSEVQSWNMDPSLLRQALEDAQKTGTLPKAILVVDAFGQTADYQAISVICEEFDIPLIEDAAESLGAKHHGLEAGTFGKIGCLSFNGNKIITSGGGGMIVTNDQKVAEKIRFFSTQACDSEHYYQHSQLGYNYRMSNLLAAVGRGQLANLNQHLQKRNAIFERYVRYLGDLPGIQFMPEPAGSISNRWLSVITIEPKLSGLTIQQVIKSLSEQQIESRPTWKPMHLQPLYSDCLMYGGDVCEEIFEKGLCLPSGSNLSHAEQDRVIACIRDLF